MVESVEREAATLLDPLRAAEPAAASRVDVARAVRSGRRRRTGRVAGIAAAVVVAISLGVVAVHGLDRHPLPVAATPTSFRLLTQEFRVEGAGGFVPYAYRTGIYWQQGVLKRAGTPDPEKPDATVTFFPAGHPPSPGWTPDGDKASSIYQHRAVYLATPLFGANHVEVAWEWSRGAWAIASVPADVADARQVAHQLAESVGGRYNGPVRAPFSVVAPPHRHLVGVLSAVSVTDPPPLVRLLFDDSDAPGRLDEAVTVGLARGSVGMVRRDAGYGLTAFASGPLPRKQLQELLDSVRVVPDPYEIANWVSPAQGR